MSPAELKPTLSVLPPNQAIVPNVFLKIMLIASFYDDAILSSVLPAVFQLLGVCQVLKKTLISSTYKL